MSLLAIVKKSLQQLQSASLMINSTQIIESFKQLQDDICEGLETLDGSTFREDLWDRPGGGGGRTRIIMGDVIEKGGVNFSAVEGTMPDNIASALGLEKNKFLATGVSIVLHPVNPFVPIIHMNVRYFETNTGKWWFGGGIDLTPHYIIEDDAQFFHQQLKAVCDKHDEAYYPKFKQWADDYFYVKHRKETRGIGGIFFDRLFGESKKKYGDFVLDVGKTFLPTYLELARRNMNKDYIEDHLEWQKVRRGRYVEFNLVWDRGTKFGLDTDGRIESILMSLPPQANWIYEHNPTEGSPEKKTLNLLKKGIDWTS
jgi:coproporphyrinogen III oxidase